jgi:hypothetical protein
MRKTYTGSCHCGAVQFECDLDLAGGTNRCNCTFCRKARFWMALAKSDAFRLLKGADLLTDYQHTPPALPAPFLHLTFCRRCGVWPFSKAATCRIGERILAVNIICLITRRTKLAQAPIRF